MNRLKQISQLIFNGLCDKKCFIDRLSSAKSDE